MIGLDGRDATASRPRARREGVHAGLIPGGTDAKAQEESCDRSQAQEESFDRSGRHRRLRQTSKAQAGGGACRIDSGRHRR